MANGRAQSRRLRGRAPRSLELGDGATLALEHEAEADGRADWTLLRDGEERPTGVSVARALELAGSEHADYVRTRTRSEVAWLQVVSEWFSDQAERLVALALQPAVVLGGEVELLQGRAHAAVEHDDALADRVQVVTFAAHTGKRVTSIDSRL